MAPKKRDNDSLRVARELAELRREVRGLFPKAKELFRFNHLAQLWFESVRGSRVDPSNERRCVERLEAALGLLTEKSLTPAKITAALVAMEHPHGPLGPESINKVISSGKLIVRHAQFEGHWGAANPFAVIKRRKVPRRNYDTLTPSEWALVAPHIPEGRDRPA